MITFLKYDPKTSELQIHMRVVLLSLNELVESIEYRPKQRRIERLKHPDMPIDFLCEVDSVKIT